MKLCDKCFAVLPVTSSFCEECGAPFGETGSGSDSVVYPEIARANLLRLRGNLAEAERVCLAVLKRFPNNPAGNGMMGDLAFEAGRLEDAKRWYEMALELTPKDEGLRRKLAAVGESSGREAQAAALSGLEVEGPSGARIAGVFAIALLVIVVGALMFWMGYANKKTREDVIEPISINGEAEPRLPAPGEEPPRVDTPPGATGTVPAVQGSLTGQEAATKSAIRSELGELGERVGVIVLDPTGAVASLDGGTDDKLDAARVGAWLVKRGAPQAYVRVVDPAARTVRFTATITKSALEAAPGEDGSPEWVAALAGG